MVSHGDLLYKLGGVEQKIDALARLVADRQTDLSEALRRLGEVEKRPDPAPIAKELQDIKALCCCLSISQLDNYSTWLRVGMILKKLGAPLSL